MKKSGRLFIMDGKNKTERQCVMRKITELKEKQEIALGILLYLDEVCRKHHLIYLQQMEHCSG